jgi:hypothetical protein
MIMSLLEYTARRVGIVVEPDATSTGGAILFSAAYAADSGATKTAFTQTLGSHHFALDSGLDGATATAAATLGGKPVFTTSCTAAGGGNSIVGARVVTTLAGAVTAVVGIANATQTCKLTVGAASTTLTVKPNEEWSVVLAAGKLTASLAKSTPFTRSYKSDDETAADAIHLLTPHTAQHIKRLANGAQDLPTPVKLIIDTDIGGGGCHDVDDVGAICIANALADNGEAELLAVVQNTQPPACAGTISVLNSHYGRGASVPIGAYQKADGIPPGPPGVNPALGPCQPLPYVPLLTEHFASPIKNTSEVPSSVDVYRAVLAAQPERSVAISSIGLATNLAALLRSGPDRFSALTGRELLARKVRPGRYPIVTPVKREPRTKRTDGLSVSKF